MPSKKTPPTLPEKLRKLAAEIEAATTPRRRLTPEEQTAAVLDDLRRTRFRDRLKARRKAKARQQAEEEEGGDTGDDGAPSAPPLPPKPPRARNRR